MGSLRSLISSYPVLRGHQSVTAIAEHVGLSKPISGIRLEDFLSQPINHQSGKLEALTVKVEQGVLALHASGLWLFSGNVHEAGVVGNHYGFGFAINFRDAQGNAPSHVHEKKLSGTVDIGGDRNDDFTVTGSDQLIRDHWAEISNANVVFTLHAATDPAQVLEAVGEALIALVAVGAAVRGLVALGTLIAPFITGISIHAHVNNDGDKEGVVTVDGQF